MTSMTMVVTVCGYFSFHLEVLYCAYKTMNESLNLPQLPSAHALYIWQLYWNKSFIIFFSSRLYCYTGNVAFSFPRVHELFLILFLSFYRCGVYGYRLVHRKLLFHGPCERQDICLQLGRRHMCHSHRCGPGEPQKHGSWSFCGVSISVHLLHTCYDCNWNNHSFFFGLLSTRETRGFWLANRLCVDV